MPAFRTYKLGLGKSQVAPWEPVGCAAAIGSHEISEIIPGQLFLGSAQDAHLVCRDNPSKITHVLNVSETMVLRPGVSEDGVVAAWVPIHDDGLDEVFGEPQAEEEYAAALACDAGARARGAWWRCCMFLEAACGVANSRVLVHCVHGVNRSPTIVIAWLMQTRRWPLSKAVRYVKIRRPRVRPVDGHMKQLVAFEKRLQVAGAEAPPCAIM
eukprot:gnl/TRDRNA2_/TRDRNA2_134281_c0_seq1.p2 gnl/TRDRNA2_/TRDRNA2_134281_c0~~gnl/TRDRNA2_/TRDRNA2_134281_c0_seq1.p2  ORF type:complete len:212 (-),score=29.14 gnl/TRDRNA2_/TRDRNA2_134281_c0_seq1:105-740(-)